MKKLLQLRKCLIKKIRCIMVCVVLVCCTFLGSIKVSATTFDDSYIIKKFYKLLDLKQYDKRAEMTCGEYKETLTEMMKDPYFDSNKIGFYNVKSVITPMVLTEVSAKEYSDVWEQCFEIASNVKAYLVYSFTVAYEETDFYNTGAQFDVVFVGTAEGKRKIISMNRALDQIVNQYKLSKGISNYAVDMNKVCMPKEIKVKMKDGRVVTVDFKLYCKRVAAQEVGYDKWPEAYHKACCVALKNYAMFHYLTRSADAGFHVFGYEDKGQNYNSSIQYNKWPNLMNAMDSVWNEFLSNNSGDCILTQYRSGNKAEHDISNKKSSGIMVQNQAKSFADDGKSYVYILNYFYGYSEASNGQALKYVHIPEHNYEYIGSYFYRCKRCGNVKGK